MGHQIVGRTRLEKQTIYITHNYKDLYDVEHSTSYGDNKIVVLRTFKKFNNAKQFAEQWILKKYEI